MSPTYLEHHGILGQKWGVRRFQDYDGRLTSAGRERYSGGNTSKDGSSKVPADMQADIEAANGGKGGIERSFLRHRNCAFCSVAYEMRRRGYNVRAQEALEGVTDDAIQKAVKNLKASDVQDYAKRVSTPSMMQGMTNKEFDDMTSKILKDGPNSRGQVTVDWKAVNEYSGPTGGHALNYEVKDGVFFLVDPQIGKAYSGKDAYNYLSNAINVKTFRSDNKQMDTKITEKYYTEAHTGRVSNDTKAENVSMVTGTIAALSVMGGHSMLMATFNPIAELGGLVVAAPFAIASGIAGNKAEKQRSEKTLELENKWQEEKRFDFYNQQKGKKKK